jgi:hypothetical protein
MGGRLRWWRSSHGVLRRVAVLDAGPPSGRPPDLPGGQLQGLGGWQRCFPEASEPKRPTKPTSVIGMPARRTSAATNRATTRRQTPIVHDVQAPGVSSVAPSLTWDRSWQKAAPRREDLCLAQERPAGRRMRVWTCPETAEGVRA